MNPPSNPHYEALASHCRFDPLFCLPCKGQEKSDVERTVYPILHSTVRMQFYFSQDRAS